MPTEVSKEIELEIAYVLFIDIVAYSKLVTSEQRRLLELLNRIVHDSEDFRKAEANHRLITIPTKVSLEGNNLRAVGEFSIERSDFKVKATSAVHGLVRVREKIKFDFDIVGHRI